MKQHDHEVSWRLSSAIKLCAVIVVLVLAWSCESWAATIEVKPGDSLQGAHDVAEPGDTLRIVGDHRQQKVDVRKDRLTIECALDAVLNGERNRDSAIVVLADDVTVRDCRIANYTASAIRIKNAKRPRVLRNTIQQIGSDWGCGPDVPKCVGYGGIHSTNMVGGVIQGNNMIRIRNHDREAGKIHCIYASGGTEDSVFENNTCTDSTGDMYKLRSAFNNVFRGNTCHDGPLCFVTGVPDNKAHIEPRSKDNQLWLNVYRDMDGFIKCRGEGQGDDTRGNCARYDVIVNDGPWEVSNVDADAASSPSHPPNSARPLSCPSGKKIRNLNGEADCNRCFPGSSDKRACRRDCLPIDDKGSRHDCARDLF